MPALRQGARGPLARLFNDFLRAQGFEADAEDHFGPRSEQGTRDFQSAMNTPQRPVKADGTAGNQTLGLACARSPTDTLSPASIAAAVGAQYPARRADLPITPDADAMQAEFGVIAFKPAGTPGHRDRIVITNGWAAEHIVTVRVPEVIGIPNAPASGRLQMHRRIAAQLQALWAAWSSRGLVTPTVRSFDGLWVPRFKRGSAREGLKDLSNHSWGTAFDINASANPLHHLPAFPGENGCVFDLVPIAQDYGFGWGGHYRGRLDGMHFEVVKVLEPGQLAQLAVASAA